MDESNEQCYGGGTDGIVPDAERAPEQTGSTSNETKSDWDSWESLLEDVSTDGVIAEVSTISVLQKFGRARRGAIINSHIANWLDKKKLEMIPPIADADYYGNVRIQRRHDSIDNSENSKQSTSRPSEEPESNAGMTGWVLSALKEDAEELDSLQYGDSVEDAMKLMDERKRTKLPVFFSKSDKSTLIGTVTLSDLTFEKTNSNSKLIEKANTHVPVVGTNEKLFDWIPSILTHGFVYGKNSKGEIVQIYTTFDVAMHLNTITAMFLRANEIEELLRESLSSVTDLALDEAVGSYKRLTDIPLDHSGTVTFTREEISANGSTEDDSTSLDKLTFADYMKCVAHPGIWSEEFAIASQAGFEKEQCIRSLNDARLARNKVMHFTRSEALENLIPSFEALAVWLRKVVTR
ncbi:CBS domain-containing protein [Arthrobacter sp. S41]|uniref:CBS domain-containing protein n=1 Tax=Arthrobacter sp. S41 TaxID=2509721 RepID=UPI001036B29E|nr:CBS domain-containing protein [Arthrobacter sp. S41]TAP27857.1 CBS domain-containing protein [Arthrobacter sp. S41]